MTRALFALTGLALLLGRAAIGAEAVEPEDLTRRAELVGREVAVDDRVKYFVASRLRQPIDELYLKRTPVIFRLPPRLRFEQDPHASAVRVQGLLKHEGDRWTCEVTALELLPPDLDRVNRGVAAALTTRDSDELTRWARWAEHRARAFRDEPLRKRARELEAEAIRIEAERKVAQPADHWLALARRAREHDVGEPEPSALAHRSFRARFVEAKSAEALRALLGEIDAFLPKARDIPKAPDDDLARWDVPYAKDPGGAYRQAPPDIRAVLDHRLWADVTQALLEREAADDPGKAIELADQAASQLPDRPRVAAKMLEDGIRVASERLGALRQRDVEALAKLYRERLRQPERAQALIRSWLDERRRHRLSATDAEGRIALARQYKAMLGDRATAIELLQEAYKIDPAGPEVADAFRNENFRKVGDRWVEPASRRAAEDDPADAATPPAKAGGDSLLHLSADEVRAKMGRKPDRIAWSASQGQLIEQWIYREGHRDLFVNLLHTPDELVPRVVAHHALPRAPSRLRP